jgi:hypothetical protein
VYTEARVNERKDILGLLNPDCFSRRHSVEVGRVFAGWWLVDVESHRRCRCFGEVRSFFLGGSVTSWINASLRMRVSNQNFHVKIYDYACSMYRRVNVIFRPPLLFGYCFNSNVKFWLTHPLNMSFVSGVSGKMHARTKHMAAYFLKCTDSSKSPLKIS